MKNYSAWEVVLNLTSCFVSCTHHMLAKIGGGEGVRKQGLKRGGGQKGGSKGGLNNTPTIKNIIALQNVVSVTLQHAQQKWLSLT